MLKYPPEFNKQVSFKENPVTALNKFLFLIQSLVLGKTEASKSFRSEQIESKIEENIRLATEQ